MAGGEQSNIDRADDTRFVKRENMLDAATGQARLHEASGPLGHDNFIVGRDVVAVSVRNEGKTLWFRRIEPQILGRKINAALVANFDHCENLPNRGGRAMPWKERAVFVEVSVCHWDAKSHFGQSATQTDSFCGELG